MEQNQEQNPIQKFSTKNKTKQNEDLAFHYWGTINYFVSLIKSSELKAGLILSFYGILLNFIYQNIERTIEYLTHHTLLYILISLWFIATVISIYYSIRSFIPRIETKYDDNVFFFGDIITKYGDIKSFSQKFYDTSIDSDARYDQMGQQIYINAKIAATKFKNVNKSLRFLAVGLILLLLIVFNYIISML